MSTRIQTRQQEALRRALKHVTEVKATHARDDIVITTYGSLCHRLPPLVLNAGLCQALALIESKARGDSSAAMAFQLARAHIAEILGVAKPADLLTQIAERDDVLGYMRRTRELLAAWVYYKRFATSILEVEASAEPPEERAGIGDKPAEGQEEAA